MMDLVLSIVEHHSTKLYEVVQSYICVEQFPSSHYTVSQCPTNTQISVTTIYQWIYMQKNFGQQSDALRSIQKNSTSFFQSTKNTSMSLKPLEGRFREHHIFLRLWDRWFRSTQFKCIVIFFCYNNKSKLELVKNISK